MPASAAVPRPPLREWLVGGEPPAIPLLLLQDEDWGRRRSIFRLWWTVRSLLSLSSTAAVSPRSCAGMVTQPAAGLEISPDSLAVVPRRAPPPRLRQRTTFCLAASLFQSLPLRSRDGSHCRSSTLFFVTNRSGRSTKKTSHVSGWPCSWSWRHARQRFLTF